VAACRHVIRHGSDLAGIRIFGASDKQQPAPVR
jgi:hypothetical protein